MVLFHSQEVGDSCLKGLALHPRRLTSVCVCVCVCVCVYRGPLKDALMVTFTFLLSKTMSPYCFMKQ